MATASRSHRVPTVLAVVIVASLLAVATFPVATTPVAAAETKIVKDMRRGPTSSEPRGLTRSGGMVFFTRGSKSSPEIYWLARTRGTRASTRLLDKDYGLGGLRSVEGTLVYTSEECWRMQFCPYLISDGTRKGSGIEDYEVRDRVAVGAKWARLGGDYLYEDSSRRPHRPLGLWRSEDGTRSGGRLVRAFSSGVHEVTKVGGSVFFTASGNGLGRELWRTDGTSSGTHPVKDIWPGSKGSHPDGLTAVGGTLFFAARSPAHGEELWKSDGTAAGTKRVRDIRPGPEGSKPKELTRLGGTLMFTAHDGRRGRELWRSDGTRRGTWLTRDIRRGSRNSTPKGLTVVAGRLYFTAWEGTHGRELWRSGGKYRSTRLVKDIRRGKKSSNPLSLTRLGNWLLFTADHPAYGREVWVHKP